MGIELTVGGHDITRTMIRPHPRRDARGLHRPREHEHLPRRPSRLTLPLIRPADSTASPGENHEHHAELHPHLEDRGDRVPLDRLAMLVAAIIMMIAHVTSLMAYIPVIVVALGAIVGGVVVRSRIQAADGQR